MLLTVHNLPSSITYAELKTLIYNKCGLSDTILDHLVNEGGTKKVTIGVADEGDAAILVRKINGLFLNGQHLYVEDVRKQKGSEQPYRSTSCENYSRPYYQTVPGYDSMPANQNMNVTGQQPPVDNFNVNQTNYYAPPDQNFSSMGYSNQNLSFALKQTSFNNPVQSYGYESQQLDDTYKSTMSLDRNSRRDNHRGRSPQRSQGREQNFPKTSRWVVGNPVREAEIRKRTPPQESWNARDRDEQNAFRPPNNYRDQQNAFRPPNDNYRDQQNGFRPPNDNYRDQQNAFRPPNDNYRYQQNAFHPLNDNYRDQQNSFGPPNDSYSDHQNNFRPPNESYRDQQSDFRPPNESYRDQQSGFRPPNDSYGDQLSLNNDSQGRESPQNDMAHNFGQQVSYDTGYRASHNQGGAADRFDMNPYESKIYGNHVTKLQAHGSAPSQWEQKDDLQTKRLNSSDKPKFGGPGSTDRGSGFGKNSNSRDKTKFGGPRSTDRGSGFGKNSREVEFPFDKSGIASNQSDNSSVPQSSSLVSNRKPYNETKSGQSVFTSSGSAGKPLAFNKPFDDRNFVKQTDNKSVERESRKRSYNADDRNSSVLPKRKYERDTRRIESFKPMQREPKVNKDQESNLVKQINKDQTWRGQATSKIAKQMIQKYSGGKSCSRLLQQLKTSIRTRIDVLLGDKFSVPCDEIIDLYRKKFHYKNDKRFYAAMQELVENTSTMIEEKKLPENTPMQKPVDPGVVNIEEKSSKPGVKVSTPPSSSLQNTTKLNKQETVKNVPKASKHTLNQNLSGKALGKEQKRIAKLEHEGKQVYTLPFNLEMALNEEIKTFVDIFKKECENLEDDSEKTICKNITELAAEDFKKVVALNVTKRILNIKTGLVLRVIGIPKPPKKASLLEFLKGYGGVIANKSEAKRLYIVTVDSHENYDELCGMGSVLIDDITVKFCPIHIIGPPQKITRAEIIQKRNQWIQNQIKEIDGQSNSNVAQDTNAEKNKSIGKTEDSEIKAEDKDDKSEDCVENVENKNEECMIIEDEDANVVVDVDNAGDTSNAEPEEANFEEFDELLEAELDENDLEDY